jgi:hypothetical protein
MKSRLEILINPTEEEIFAREPLIAFSFYLSGCNNLLLSLSDEIIDNLDKGFLGSTIDTGYVGKASASMWFWILGAYEVTRTISQANDCFSIDFIERVDLLKKELSIVRMPIAKMEKRGAKEPVLSERSPDGWDIDKKDLLVGDPDNPISARQLLQNYENTVLSLRINDVKKKHAESISYNKSIK